MAKVLVLNCGSSSVKFAVIETSSGDSLVTGLVENLGPNARLKGKSSEGFHESILAAESHGPALEVVVQYIDNLHLLAEIVAVGHRVVHGGERFSGSVRIDEQVLDAIRACSDLAPLHNPANLIGIEVATRVFPSLPQIAVFDTAFHQTIPAYAYLYPLPQNLYAEHGVRRYGFHGTSHRYVSAQTARILQKDPAELCIITAHLGNGCSATAIAAGKSVDTTMGLTPMEGIPMGTRSGTIDPGIFFHLHQSMGWDFDRINKLLNKESGLLGLSGLSNDMRTLAEARANGHEGANVAIEVFCYRLAKEIAALTVALPRLDALVFTGGIGENSAPVRARTMELLTVLGFQLDAVANSQHGRTTNGCISLPNSRLTLVVPTNEELLIALDAEALVS